MSTQFQRTTPPGILTLVLATSTTALSMNVFLPSLPGMARYFDVDYSLIQLTISGYIIATGVMQLLIGPASDRFGRRPVMLASFTIFVISTLAAIFAPTIEFLLAARMFQAFSAAGTVLSRAVVRDTLGPAEAASRMGYVTMGMSLTPMIGPILGGAMDQIWGWQSTFLLTLGLGLTALALIYFDLGETLKTRSSSFGNQFRQYPALLRSRLFWGYTLAATFTSGSFFALIGGGPYLAHEIFHLSPAAYGGYFALASIGYLIGNFFVARYSVRIGVNRMMLVGNCTVLASMVMSTALLMVFPEHAMSLFGPMLLMGAGNGIALPSSMTGIVSSSPAISGSASGLGGSLQMLGGGVITVAAGSILSPDWGCYPVIVIMAACALAGAASAVFVMATFRKRGLETW